MGNWEVVVKPGAIEDWIERTAPDTSEQIELVFWVWNLTNQFDAPAVIGTAPSGFPLVQATEYTEAEVTIQHYRSGPPFGVIVVNRFY